MAKDENTPLAFRSKALKKITSPEQLTDYLRVTNPGIWIILAAVILLLTGLFVWAGVGTLETTAEVTIVVEDHTAHIAAPDSGEMAAGMPLKFAGEQFTIASVEQDNYGRNMGIAAVDVPDGTYQGTIVTDQTKPLDFLLKSR